MEVDAFAKARSFAVGVEKIELKHVANIALEPDEMVTFISQGDREYDVVAKDWGYYATPSVGGRLRRFEMRAALMRNIDTLQAFVVLVFDDQTDAWHKYMKAERQEFIMWLGDEQAIFHNPNATKQGGQSNDDF